MPAEGNNTTQGDGSSLTNQQLVMFGDIFVKALVCAIENERNKLLYLLTSQTWQRQPVSRGLKHSDDKSNNDGGSDCVELNGHGNEDSNDESHCNTDDSNTSFDGNAE